MNHASQAMSQAQIERGLASLSGWALLHGKLQRTWSFADFVQAIAFVNRVAALAEQAGHHPDIDIRYNRVTLGLTTHDAGGITAQDFSMAQRLNQELAQG